MSSRRKPIDVILECKTPDPKVRRRRDAPAPVPAEHARCISALHTDGSTKFACYTDRQLWNPRWALLFDKLLDLQAQQQLEEDDVRDPELPPDVLVPLPPLPSDGRKLGLAGVLEATGEKAIDYRTRGFGMLEGLPIAHVNVSGRAIVLHFVDRCYVTITRRRDPKEQRSRWYVKLDAKARELYERGDREWMRTWLGLWSWLLFGTWAEPGSGKFRELGWGTTIWHVNSDFVGLEFVNEDALDVTATRKRTLWGKTDRPEWDVDDEDEDLDGPEDDDDEDDGDADEDVRKAEWMQTMDLGRIGSDIRVIGYKKGDHCREVKRVEPAASKYGPRWRAEGDYDQPRDGDPYRVEIRARKKGLVYRHKDRDEVIYDFRDPDMLLHDEARRAFWAYVTGRRRVAVREPGPRGGVRPLRKCATDPRWLIVQAAAQREARADIRQMPHLVANLTRAEREVKSAYKLFEAVQTLSLIRNGTAIVEPIDFAAELELLAQRLRSGELVLDGLGRGTLPHPLQPSQSIRRKPALVQFFARELVGLHEPHAEALRQRGGTGGCSVFDMLPIPPEPEEDDPPDHDDDTEPDG